MRYRVALSGGNNLRKFFIAVLLFIAVVIGGKTIVVDFFGISTCQSCAEMEALLDGLRYETEDEVLVKKYSLAEPENQQLKLKFSKVYGLTESQASEIPLFFIGDSYFTYDVADVEAILGAFESYDEVGREAINGLVGAMDSKEANAELETRLDSFSFLVVIAACLIDGINPCAFVVLLFLVSYLYLVGRERLEILLAGIFFALGIFLAYLVLGAGLLEMVGYFERVSRIFQLIFYPLMTVLTAVLAILSVVDFFRMRYGNKQPVLQLSNGLKRSTHSVIRKYARSRAIWIGSFIAGLIISLVEFMCTGQIYLPTIVYLIKSTDYTVEAMGYLIVYNIGFTVPIIAITMVAYFTSSVKKIQEFMTEKKAAATVKLIMACIFIVFFAFMLQTSLKMF